MAEELQHLIDRINAEGVAKAEEKAAGIIAEAERRAVAIVADAERKAAAAREAAERDSNALRERAEVSLKQAGRDLSLSVKRDISETLARVLRRDADAALASPDVLSSCLESAVKALGADAAGAEVHVPPAQADALAAYARARLADEVAKGLVIAPDSDVASGLSVRVDGGRVEFDFTGRTLEDALAAQMRPALAKTVFGE